ncbi:MAG: hypothetical protein EZS28_025976 [Streblomastix strix]|uniref:Dockerin domain-containing protein n=1 Tax=Streblomastix strix TaxID=222440 RepID=A0A5J4V6T2_9EUKA|nr:MAG: hypothetical protein EZS28_025976 [Streblomastix strix]
MPTVTGSSFIKFGADTTVILLGVGGTKPISKFFGSDDVSEVDGDYITRNYVQNYEPLKRVTSDVNSDGKINIVDYWHVNSVIDAMKSIS